MTIITETERLYLREFTREDAIHFFNMNNNPEVIRYTGDQAFESVEEAEGFLKNYKQYQLYKMGRWAVCDKQTHTFLGWCGLKFHPEEAIVEVGFRFYQENWNKGYATESAKASIAYGFQYLKLKEIYAHVQIENIASQRVLEKCGMQFVKEIVYDGFPAKLYKIEAKN